MTNPDNIVRVRARNGGRASVYEANGWAQAYTSGLLEGNGVVQNTVADMHVLVGGSTTKPDVVLAENASGYKVALDLIGQQPLTITTPASNSRISAIVAYTDDLALATTEDSVTGSPASCGLIVVNGTASATPSAPNDAAIRSAITADGATGSQAAYCVIATILVANDTTTITDSLITNNPAQIGAPNIDFTTFDFNPNQSSGYYLMGNLLFCWGYYQLTVGMQAYSESTHDFTFAKAFSDVPTIMVSNGDLSNTCGEYSLISQRSATGCKVIGGHVGTSTSDKMLISYLAIGVIQ